MAITVFPKPVHRSPFKRKPLRMPGQSIQDEMNRLLEDRMIPIVVFVGLFAVYALNDWMITLGLYRPMPRFTSTVALVGIVYLTYKYFDFKRTAERLRMARDGERHVGQFLEDLRAGGARVFHDLVGDHFNIDHVVVSKHGIFVLETKSYNKPKNGDPTVQYDGERLFFRGTPLKWNPVRQAKSLAGWLRDQLLESTGKRFPIRPVVLLPGWFVELHTKDASEVWVLNPKMLKAFIEREPMMLSSEDVALVASRIVKDMQKL